MGLKEISKDIYNVDAWMDEQYGKVGSSEREEFRKEAYAYCVGQSIHDTRKQENGIIESIQKSSENKTDIS